MARNIHREQTFSRAQEELLKLQRRQRMFEAKVILNVYDNLPKREKEHVRNTAEKMVERFPGKGFGLTSAIELLVRLYVHLAYDNRMEEVCGYDPQKRKKINRRA